METVQGQTPESTPAVARAFNIPTLDGLRTVAAMIVFLAHAGLQKYVPGGFGVTIFFFLSGYLITTLMRREVDKYDSMNLKSFYLRRVLRIFPPLYIVLFAALLYTLVIGFAGFQLQPASFVAQMFHFYNFWAIGNGTDGTIPGSPIVWSLAIEEHFYLVFPLIYLLMRRLKMTGKQQAIAFWVMCGLILLWRCVLVMGFQVPSDRIYMGTDTRVDSMLFGCALAVFGNPAMDTNVVQSLNTWRRFLLPASLALLAFTLVARDDTFRETLRYTLQGIGLYAVFIVGILQPTYGFFRVLNWGWVSFLGVISYTFYLTHYIFLEITEEWIPGVPVVQGIVALVVTIAASMAMYHWVEMPIARLRKRLAKQPAGAAVKADAIASK